MTLPPMVATLAALALCWPAWEVAGMAVAGLGAAALPLRLALLVLALGGLGRLLDRRP